MNDIACGGPSIVVTDADDAQNQNFGDQGLTSVENYASGQLVAIVTCGSFKFGRGLTILTFRLSEDEGSFKKGVNYVNIGNCRFRQKSSGAACFPANAKVTLASGFRVPIEELRTGDEVYSGSSQASKTRVIAWTHEDAHVWSTFIRASHDGGASLTLSPGHLLRVRGALRPAFELRKGDVLQGADGKPRVLTDVSTVRLRGLYNPQTIDGSIVVDDIVVSTYTTAVPAGAAHALLAPVRAAFQMGVTLFRVVPQRWISSTV